MTLTPGFTFGLRSGELELEEEFVSLPARFRSFRASRKEPQRSRLEAEAELRKDQIFVGNEMSLVGERPDDFVLERAEVGLARVEVVRMQRGRILFLCVPTSPEWKPDVVNVINLFLCH